MQPVVSSRHYDLGGNVPTQRDERHDTRCEPPDVFCSIGSLIVEGRVPHQSDERGYREGPHVPPLGGGLRQQYAHCCSAEEYMCKKDDNFRKHMLLLWQNNVPVSIELLLCSDCRIGKQKAASVEYSTTPEPGSILLEQWTVSVQSIRPRESYITSHGLFQAVRSYLHFSQLSAWLSSSRGEFPKNVLCRITIPSEAFVSKFSVPPEQHIFPPGAAGRGCSVHVSVKALPRTGEIPRVFCPHAIVGGPPLDDSPLHEDGKLPMAGALAWSDVNSSESDLRKALAKSKLAECPAISLASNLPRSDSMDSMLGDSLLDPPQSLQKFPPKRYQSPSRCGSPSLETPEYLLFGHKRTYRRRPSISDHHEEHTAQERCARQDHLRRRDLNLYLGLPPRVLHSGITPLHSPRLSLPPRVGTGVVRVGTPSGLSGPYRAFPGPVPTNPTFSNRMPIRCNIQGKHVCSAEEEDPEGSSKVESPNPHRRSWTHEYVLNKENIRGTDSEDEDQSPVDQKSWGNSPFSSRRSSFKDEDPDQLAKILKKRSSLHDIFDDGTGRKVPFVNPDQVTTVYRAETSPLLNDPKPLRSTANDRREDRRVLNKSEILLGAIIRTSERNQKAAEMVQQRREGSSNLSPECVHKTMVLQAEVHEPPKGLVDQPAAHLREFNLPQPSLEQLGARLKATLTLNGSLGQPTNKARARCFSDNIHSIQPDSSESKPLEPLDISFDHEGLSPASDSLATSPTGNDFEFDLDETDHGLINGVPSSNQMNYFRQSFDSATSMVFHGRTGLPLTSSPAPLRKGKGKFEFDSTINSPHDIKRAFYRSEKVQIKSLNTSQNGAPLKTPSRNRQQPLSVSAPATVTSSNLLGNFEESVLNGRLEPVSTVAGFTAEIGASGSFHPKHKTLPVTVFFYTLCDNNSLSSPYLGHINLGKKGYRVPEKGTIQVTLFNPLGTVVKMFVIMYDLSDMPPNSQTFLRQRTLYMPSDCSAKDYEADSQKWLRYLVHLRFSSSKSGKIYLHTDIRMIIFRKSDLDTASDHSPGKGFELRSFTRGPQNPKFSLRK
eukprot:maker-scaffold329_size204955-snap-gene-1.23 protein:Tk00275 transcript:maker-scaffold329_size204955-snap-gene-1.23-mRNA-1 annotation:"protein fam214a"